MAFTVVSAVAIAVTVSTTPFAAVHFAVTTPKESMRAAVVSDRRHVTVVGTEGSASNRPKSWLCAPGAYRKVAPNTMSERSAGAPGASCSDTGTTVATGPPQTPATTVTFGTTASR